MDIFGDKFPVEKARREILIKSLLEERGNLIDFMSREPEHYAREALETSLEEIEVSLKDLGFQGKVDSDYAQ